MTMIKADVATKLELNGINQPLRIQWTDKTTKTVQNSKKVTLRINGQGKPSYTFSAQTMSDLSLPSQSLTLEDVNILGFENIPISTYTEMEPELLIGLDNSFLMHPGQTIRKDGVSTSETVLGWAIEGVTKKHESQATRTMFTGGSDLHQIVAKFIDADNLGIIETRAKTQTDNDKRAHEIMKQSTKRKGERYETRLLWKSDNEQLPDNYQMAVKRFNSFEKKLSHNKQLRAKVHTLVKSYIEKGYATQTTHNQPETNRTWYLPMFVVQNPNKPEKVRLVWDAAAEYQGCSLNKALLVGPDLLEPLWNVLVRFRQHQFAFCADVSEMFHQIEIHPDDRSSQRFLWRWNQESPIETYEMNVMTFGAACSPSIAQYVKNHNAMENQRRYPDAAKAIMRNYYVDDWQQSCRTEAEAVALAKRGKTIQAAAGMKLHKWVANSAAVLQAVSDESDPTAHIDIPDATQKTLGMSWDVKSDSFWFDVGCLRIPEDLENGSRPPTKREMLSIVMSVFDPLGLIAHMMIAPKLIMRETWREDCDWDESIPKELAEKWSEWMKTLHQLEKLRIPRWCGIASSTRELHIFVDASERALAAVAYVRATQDGRTIVSLAAAKTRVTSLIQKSIPRLELQAAVLGIRLGNMLKMAADEPYASVTYWTDAKDVLWWLKFARRRYKPFVAVRIGEILSHSDPNDWRWVPSRWNPADWGTKWMPRVRLVNDTLWWNGPNFLRDNESNWPKTNFDPSEAAETEVLKILNIRVVDNGRPDLVADAERISRWDTLVRATAWALRFAKCGLRKRGPLDTTELKDAENEVLKKAQDEFGEEGRMIRQGRARDRPKKSKLSKMSAFLGKDGLIRMRSRNIKAMYLPYDAQYPIIIPKDSIITKRLVQHYHERCGHGNYQTALNEMRQRFITWGVRVKLNQIIRSCPKCALIRAKPVAPEMAAHPQCRLAANCAPFTHTGMDLFGPFLVRVGRRTEKRWGVIFTCLTIRAVHLEIAQNLSGPSCVRAIQNFVGRRGLPTEFRCDNGTNFVAASRIYRGPYGEQPRWLFNPPAAPHMGGAWERLVRSVKTALRQLAAPINPTDEELRNFLIRAEFMINSRPLTEVSVANEEQESLTPNHFLLGNSNGAKMESTSFNLRHDLAFKSDLLSQFWQRWIKEYLPTIAARPKWHKKATNVNVGDLVYLCDTEQWIRGAVDEIFLDPESHQVRQVVVRTSRGTYRRPVTKIAVIRIERDQTVDSKQ